jgi:AcrR family transcriptional regulator
MPRARKSTAKPAGRAGPNRADGDAKSRLIETALDLAAQRSWRGLGMAEIAREAKLPLGEAYEHFRAKPCLLAAFTRSIDREVLAGGEPEGASRDRLFELLMRRFDALKPRRPALKAILRDSLGEPTALWGVPQMLNSMAWMLEAAGISTAGWRGRLRVLALAGAYGAVFRTFLNDEGEDLAKTMAALDRHLNRGPFRGGEATSSPRAA